jgi:transcription elongation factor Elf1
MSETKSQPMTVSIEKMHDCPRCGSSDVYSDIPAEDASHTVETLECRDCLFAWEIEYDVNRDVPEPEPPEITSRPAVVWTDDD